MQRVKARQWSGVNGEWSTMSVTLMVLRTCCAISVLNEPWAAEYTARRSGPAKAGPYLLVAAEDLDA